MKKLDKIDKKILYYMDLNARAPLSEVARYARISKPVAAYRLKKMENEGIITHYVTVVNTSALGKPLYLNLFFVLQNVTDKRLNEFVDYLNAHNSVGYVALMDGEYELDVFLGARDIYEFRGFLDEIRGTFGDLISEIVYVTPIRAVFLRKSYLIGKKVRDEEPLEALGKGSTLKLDDIDQGILSVLAKNARTKTTVIATRLKESPLLIARRIKSLEKRGVIMGYRTALTTLGTGFNLLFALKNVTPKRYKELISYLGSNPYCIFLAETLGSYDVSASLEVENSEQYYELRMDIRNRFSDIIKRMVPFAFGKITKYVYLP